MSDATPAPDDSGDPPVTPPISTRQNSGESSASTISSASVKGVDSTASAEPGDANQTGPYVASADAERDGPTGAGSGERYQTRRLHRKGGLGAVWLARDTLLGRDVALKTIRPDRAATPGQMARFTHEARVTGQLEHPGIVPLYDLIPDEQGEDVAASTSEGKAPPRGPRYVMRFVTGRTLSESAAGYHHNRTAGQATRLDLANLLDAFIAVCRAVAYAHSRGILHRDLKGLNVILGEFGEVFLIDWGLAKSITDAEADTPDIYSAADDTAAFAQTQAGAKVGTPAFMSPEVAAGQPATKLSDVYGLGAILYEILAGSAPYHGGHAGELLAKVLAEDPAPVRSANPSAPPALAAICRKAMARNPSDRYTSAEEVATEVRRWLADEPVTAYREPWTARTARWARRHRTVAIAAAVLLLTATIASSIGAALVWREQQHTEVQRIEATKNADAAIGVVRDLSTYVESIELANRNTTAKRRWENLDVALASYERLFTLHPEDPALRWNVARMHRMRANLAKFLDKMEEAEKSYHEAIRLFDGLAAEFKEKLEYREAIALVLYDYSDLVKRLGRSEEGAKMVDDSVRLFEDLLRAKPKETNYQRLVAYMLMDRSDGEFQVGRFVDAERMARRSTELYEQLAKTPGLEPEPFDPLFHAIAEHNLAMVLREQARIDDALAAHNRAVEIMTALIKVNAGRDAWSFYHRARTERAWTQGRFSVRSAAAIADLQSAIAGWDELSKKLGEVPVDLERKGVAGLYCGRLRARAGQREAAVKDLSNAAQVLEKLVAKRPGIPAYRYDLGRIYTALGQTAGDSPDAARWYAKARDMLREAMKLSPENVHYGKAAEELESASKK